MHIPKNYFHNRTVLALLSVNAALFLLSVMGVILGVNPGENPNSIVAYRAVEGVDTGQISGPTGDLYQFALFSIVVTVAAVMISMKLYSHRKHLSVGVLGMNILLLAMAIIIFNALTRTL